MTVYIDTTQALITALAHVYSGPLTPTVRVHYETCEVAVSGDEYCIEQVYVEDDGIICIDISATAA